MPGTLPFRGAAQKLGGVDHADAVGQHQVGVQQSLAERLVLPGGQQKLRVGGDGVVESLVFHQAGPGGGGLLQRQVVKANAQYVCPQNQLPPIGSYP